MSQTTLQASQPVAQTPTASTPTIQQPVAQPTPSSQENDLTYLGDGAVMWFCIIFFFFWIILPFGLIILNYWIARH